MLRRCLYALLSATLFLFLPTGLWAAEPPLTVNLAYQAERSRPVTYEIDLAAIVTAPYHTKTLKVWLPIPTSDFAQEVTPGEITVFPQAIKPQFATEKVHGNQFAYFEFDKPAGAQIIRHRFRITTYELTWNIDPRRLTQPEEWPDDFDPYLRSDQAVVVNAAIDAQVKQIVRARKDAASDMTAVMQWMHQTMKYDHAQASLAASSLHALENKTGHCSDYHGLCSAFGRALGYPSRVTYGMNTFPKNSPSHCKLEVYLPPYGWVSFDVSETQRLMQAIENDKTLSDDDRATRKTAAFQRLQNGFRDNTWFLQTRGTSYDLVPPAKQKVNVVRTLYAEADGVPLPEPDPADPKQNKFAWQIGMQIEASRKVAYPFSHQP